MIRVGGWGPFFGDEGGGYWIGNQAVRTALRLHDAHENPEFVSIITRTLGLQTISDVVTAWKSGTVDVQTIAAIAPRVFDFYPAEPAAAILREAANHLRQIAETAIGRVGVSGAPVSVIGSIGTHPVMLQLIGLDFAPAQDLPQRGAIIWACRA
jgi:N-acetylglucosamine kinase-like BadF-type ATPase